MWQWIRRHKICAGLLSLFLVIVTIIGSVSVVFTYQVLSQMLVQKSILAHTQKFVVTIGMPTSATGSADYTCTGVNETVQFHEAYNALPANGGRLGVLAAK